MIFLWQKVCFVETVLYNCDRTKLAMSNLACKQSACIGSTVDRICPFPISKGSELCHAVTLVSQKLLLLGGKYRSFCWDAAGKDLRDSGSDG